MISSEPIQKPVSLNQFSTVTGWFAFSQESSISFDYQSICNRTKLTDTRLKKGLYYYREELRV